MLYNVKFVKALNLTDIDEMILHYDEYYVCLSSPEG